MIDRYKFSRFMFVLIFLPVLFLSLNEKVDAETSGVTVVGSNVEVHESNSTDSAVITTVNDKEHYSLIETKDGWVLIQLNADETGWVNEQYILKKVSFDGEVTATVLNIRDTPNTETSNVVGKLVQGDVVKVVGEHIGWYQILYEDKELWVSAQYVAKVSEKQLDAVSSPETSSEIPLTLIERTNLYNSSSLSESPVASVSPQNVTAIEQQGDWYLINTWIGPKWIKPRLMQETEPEYKKITLTKRTYLYKNPTTNGSPISSVSPQEVTVVSESASGWLQINTWIGPMWIEPQGFVYPLSQKIDLISRTNIHNSPNSKPISSISPQTVTAVAKVKDSNWYQINTWLGPKWIELTHGNHSVSTNEQIVLKRRTYIYNTYNKSSYPVSSLSAQTVTAIKKIENSGWYQVNTWLGPKWIQLPSLNGKVIVIDAGHGGYDPGAVGSKYGTKESHINLSTAKYLYDYLKNAGATVYMTRSNDTFISLPGRIDISHHRNADAFVSIHYNSSESRIADGVMSFYYSSSKDFGLAQTVQAELAKTTGLDNEGVRFGDFHVLRENRNRSVLVELGFLSNPLEEAIIRNSGYHKNAALGIYNGLEKYFSN
jgi:N-acetylmuramoyl-L-alanine amidase